MLNSIKFLSYSILLISVYSVLQWSSLSMTIVNNTFFWWLLQALILYNFYKIGNREIKNKIVSLFLIYVVLSFLYGIYMSENYSANNFQTCMGYTCLKIIGTISI